MIAVVFALGFEAKNFNKHANNSNIEYCICNLTGRRITDEIYNIIRKNNIQCIVLLGFAGGLNTTLRVGDVILAKNYTSPQFLPHFEFMAGTCRAVHLKTVERVIEARAEKERCWQEWGADCCDMESAHVWKVAQSLSIPMITVRSISDAWDSDMPIPGNILIDPRTSKPNTLRILGYLMRHPQCLPEFLRMVRHASCAAKRLASVAEREIIPVIKRSLAKSISSQSPTGE
jgi:hypothetical protein